MKHVSITLSQAVDGFNLARRAEQLSPHTLSDYNTSYRKLQRWFRELDPRLDELTVDDIREFLDGMGRMTVQPDGVAPRRPRRLSKKTILNIHTGLSSLWTWAVGEGYVEANIIRSIKPPKPERTAIAPFSKEDVELLLS